MNFEENRHALQLEDTSPTNAKTEHETAAEVEELQPLDEVPSPSVDREPEPGGLTPSIVAEPAQPLKTKASSASSLRN